MINKELPELNSFGPDYARYLRDRRAALDRRNQCRTGAPSTAYLLAWSLHRQLTFQKLRTVAQLRRRLLREKGVRL